MLTASPKKLRSGEWGALVYGVPEVGDAIRIKTKAGKEWTAVVKKVIWSGSSKRGDGKVAIVATESTRRRRRDYYGWSESCGYPCPVDGHICTPEHPCHDCAP